MTQLGRLKRVNLRTIWPNEAHHFTPWLAENIDALGEALGIDLELIRREAGVGGFSLDLLATDLGTNDVVIIENQFGSTDHNHLGQLLTYAAGFDAGAIIWVAEGFRDEHREALDWINQRTDAETRVFGVVIEALQIDDSLPAFQFRPVVFPNEWTKEKRSSANPPSSRGLKYRDFFQHMIDVLRDEHHFTNARVGQPQNWYAFSTGLSGFRYGVSFAQGGRVRVELYIDSGDAEWNKAFFDWMEESRHELEAEVGDELEWERMDDRQASRIAAYRSGSIEDDEDSLAEIRKWAIEKLLKFREVMGPSLHRWVKEADR
jgi:hypothetical protein